MVTYYPEIVHNLLRELQNFNLSAPISRNEALAPYTTFRVGGPADLLARPRSADELTAVVAAAHATGIPLTVLGGGANVVVSDRGIRGLVVHTGAMCGVHREDTRLHVLAGTPVSDAAAHAANEGLAGLDFIYAMPGSTGGAIWMNARCYDGEIAGILQEVRFIALDQPGRPALDRYLATPDDFGYKISPFQDGRRIIVGATFSLAPGGTAPLWEKMRAHEEDRRQKGHFDAPCAGSVFKNNRSYGEPSGRIIDRVGLRGHRLGGARVSDRHGNIIINAGGASARDIRDLTEYVQVEVHRRTGFMLDPEILFVGEW